MTLPQTQRRLTIAILEQIDPLLEVPSGIDKMIEDIVRYGEGIDFALIGVSHDASTALGEWVDVTFGGRMVKFLPVARVDKARHRKLPHSLRLVLGAARYRRKIRADLIHVHRVETGAVVSAVFGIDYVQFVHNDTAGLLGSNSDSTWRHFPRVYRALERRAITAARRTLLFNWTEERRLLTISNRVERLLTWYDEELFGQVDRSPRIRSGGEVRACMVGRLESQKDPLLALRVVAASRASGTDLRLTIVGTGSMEQQVRRETEILGIGGAVDLVGAVPHAAIPGLLADHDLLVLTSHYEGSPTVIAEANAAGRPVLCTREADPDCVVIAGLNGLCVDSREPTALAAALDRALEPTPEQCASAVRTRTAAATIRTILAVPGFEV